MSARPRAAMRRRAGPALAVAVAVLGVAAAAEIAPGVLAGALLHPSRSPRRAATPPGCADHAFRGAGVRLRGWLCPAAGTRRGHLVILHGVADSRASVAGLVERFTRRGLQVVAYDSRAHGESDGDSCTYGYTERQDLRRVIDSLQPGPLVLMGTSLGGAVALQAAAGDLRVTGVVAAEVFSDLRAIARDRTPAFVPDWMLRRAFRLAEARAGFEVDAVSPVAAARSISAPVLLVHGARDTDTPPIHSERVHDALRGPRRLILVEGARHNESLQAAAVWADIEDWIERLFAARGQ